MLIEMEIRKKDETGQIRTATATATNHFFENNWNYIWYETDLTLVDWHYKKSWLTELYSK